MRVWRGRGVGMIVSAPSCCGRRAVSDALSGFPPTTFQPNFTSVRNRVNRTEDYVKFHAKERPVPVGIPRISRLATRPISILHETPRVMVAGRNYANGFACNQFLLIHRPSHECIFIDAVDDWPDDWISFLKSSRLTPTHVFLTHCHVDNILSLTSLLGMMEREMGRKVGVMWNSAELPWVEWFPRACHRYGRAEEAQEPLPLLQSSPFTYRAPPSSRGPRIGGPSPNPGRGAGGGLARPHDIILSSATNRSTSFYEFGPHVPLHYIYTPGHSPGHTVLSVVRERLLFTGDLLFYNQIGRVDLPYGVGERLAESLMCLEDFPDETVLLPGHGRLTTLGRERRENRGLSVLYERKRSQPHQSVSVGFNAGYL